MKRIAALVLALALTLCAPAVLADKALKAGQRSQAVLELQERLIQLGLLDGSADGIFGNATQSAVKEFQRCLKANGYNVDVDGVAAMLLRNTCTMTASFKKCLPWKRATGATPVKCCKTGCIS